MVAVTLATLFPSPSLQYVARPLVVPSDPRTATHACLGTAPWAVVSYQFMMSQSNGLTATAPRGPTPASTLPFAQHPAPQWSTRA